MELIKLTQCSTGKPIYVNPQAVVYMSESPGDSTTHLMLAADGGQQSLYVKEPLMMAVSSWENAVATPSRE